PNAAWCRLFAAVRTEVARSPTATSLGRWRPSANCPRGTAHSLEQSTCRSARTGTSEICKSWVSFRNATVAEFSGLAQQNLHSEQGAIDEERDVLWMCGGGRRAVGRCQRSRQDGQDEVRDELHGLHRAIAGRGVHARPRD